MKLIVKCIDNVYFEDELTIGKFYEMYEDNGEQYLILDNKNQKLGVNRCNFEYPIKKMEFNPYKYLVMGFLVYNFLFNKKKH